MKKILFVFLLTLNSFFVKAQWVTINDTNFRNSLILNGLSGCISGNLLDTTCPGVLNKTALYCGGQNISDINGIQYFDSLQNLECDANHLTYLPTLPISLKILECEENQLTSLPSLPSSLVTLLCYMNNLMALPTLPDSLQVLVCWNNNLTSLPSLPSTLITLGCHHDSLTSLPSLPDSLQILNCSNNLLTSLPALPNSLLQLYCDFNMLDTLPVLPDSLVYIDCGSNDLSNLPVLPSTLVTLKCGSNNLSQLPSLPSTLQYLICEYNGLISISSLPNLIQTFYCGVNQLISLPGLSDSLKYLKCESNPLTSLPTLPPHLWSLDCSWDWNLNSLPNLPDSLVQLKCSNAHLISLPDLPKSLLNLDCSTNIYLNDIPDLPDSVSNFDIHDNIILSCFPKYKKINTLNWSNTAINCLPNAGFIGTATPAINNLPICQPGSGCDFEWNIFGSIYKDANSNCTEDSNEIEFKNIPVELDSGGSQLQLFIFNTEGYYSFQTGLGNYQIKIDTTGLPFDVTCPASGNYLSSLTAIDSLDADLDFGLQCKTGYLDLIAKSISPSAQLRPASQRTIYLNAGDATLFYGVTCSAGVSGSVEAILNGPVSYISPAAGALTPTAFNGDTISWSVNDFSLINPAADFNIIIQVDSSATVNDTICVQLNITPVTGDNIPSNNSVSNCFPVVNSFDPNAKEIFPAGFVDTTAYDFTFTIYFQNTGNAVAENIYILDTLDNDLKLNTFQFLSSSHDVITQLLPGRVLRFSFPHINLPDSISNEPASHGYVQFKMMRKNILYPDMIILNHAQIFFDLNPPVTTNDAYAVLNFDCSSLFGISIPLTEICEDETLFAYNTVNFPFSITYEWLIDSTVVSTDSSLSLSGLTKGTYQLSLHITAGYCDVSYVKTITVFPLPPPPVINISGDTLTTNYSTSYQWFFNNTLISGATQYSYLISQSGWYSVMITDSDGCSAFSDSVFVSPVGIEEVSEVRFNMYPNPVNDMLYIQTISRAGEILNIELSDITGRKLKTIFRGKTTSAFSKYSLSLKSFSKGVFILHVNSLVKRIVIE